MIPRISRINTTKPIIAAVDMPFFLQLPSSSTPLPEQQSAPSVVTDTSPSAMHSVGSEGEGAELGAPPDEDGTERGAPPELVARGDPPMAEAGPELVARGDPPMAEAGPELVARGDPPIINSYCPEPVKLRALPMDEAGS
jgi:hypothetical protein